MDLNIKTNLFYLICQRSATNFQHSLEEDLFDIEPLMFALASTEQSSAKSMWSCNKTVGDGYQGVCYVFKHA